MKFKIHDKIKKSNDALILIVNCTERKIKAIDINIF